MPEYAQARGLAGLLPHRITKRGRPTTVSNWEVSGDRYSTTNMESETRWSPTPHLTPSQQRLVLSVVLEEAIITVMSNHVYRFGQEVFQQVEGGAIGSRLTGAVARLTMDDWMDQYNEVLEDNGWTMFLNKKYFDDINLAVEDP